MNRYLDFKLKCNILKQKIKYSIGEFIGKRELYIDEYIASLSKEELELMAASNPYSYINKDKPRNQWIFDPWNVTEEMKISKEDQRSIVEATAKLKKIELTDENYQIILDRLIKRHGNIFK